jgi:cytoskeleton protein RodZ
MADIGTTLREARMRARIDITEVEARTKIRAKYLRAIENEEWDLLPGPVYVKSFLRTYGDFLGLDSRALVDEFKRRYERPSDQDLRPISSLGRERDRERERRRRRPRLGPAGAIVLVLAAVVAALYLVGSRTGNSTSSASTAITSARQPTTGTGTRAHHAHRAAGAGRPAAPPKPRTVSLKLVATGSVYVCVLDGQGKKLIPGVIYAPGESIPTEQARKLLLTLGNDAVRMTVNGKSVPVAVGSPIGYELTPGKLNPLPRALMPTCT